MTDDSLLFPRPRVDALLGTLERLAAGDTDTSIELSSSHDELDAIAFGINVLADELRFVHRQMTEAAQLKARELHLQMEEAERASEAKTVFLRNASHEIRTPITVILSIAELLAMPDLPAQERSDLVRKLRANCQAVLSLVSNLLDLSRLEGGAFTRVDEPVSPSELIREVVESFEPHARRKGLTMRADISKEAPAMIATDPVRLRQMLVNVIGNAVKYTETGGVAISVGYEPGDRSMLRIDIRDTGPGIPAARREQIFEPFGHADSPIARVQGGTGLGLAISKRLAEQLGGTLSLLDTDGRQGCTFRIGLEAVPVHMPPADAGPSGQHDDDESALPLEHMRILLAEDSLELQSAVRRLLRAVGASVECAVDGQEATVMAGAGQYDLILMDLVMPNMGGLEAARVLRSNGDGPPIVAFTGDATAEVHRAAREAGCNDVLSKPFDASQLIATIRHLVVRHRSQSAGSEARP